MESGTAAAPARDGGKDDSTVSAKIGSRPQNKSRRDDAAVPAVSSRTSFARCSNFLLSQKRSDTTVIADRASPGGLGMSGSGWSRQGRTNGTSECFLCPFGTSDPGVGRHVQATQDVNSLYPRTVPDSSDCRLEGQVDPSTNWSGVRVYVVCKLRSGGAGLFACCVLLSGIANGNDGRGWSEGQRPAK